MAFPEIYKERLNVGTYIPEDKLDSVIEKILKRINKIVADVRKDLTTVVVEREAVNVSLNLAKQLVINVPVGTTNAELVKINKAIKEEVMVVQVSIPELILDQSCEAAGGDFFQIRWLGNPPIDLIPCAQTFTSNVTGLITKVELWCGVGGPSGNLIISIQTVDISGKPTGTVLESVIVDAGTMIDAEWFSIDLSADTQLTKGTKYAIVINSNDFSGGYIGINCGSNNTEDGYARGELLVNVGGIWNTIKNSGITSNLIYGTNNNLYHDMWFRTYMLTA